MIRIVRKDFIETLTVFFVLLLTFVTMQTNAWTNNNRATNHYQPSNTYKRCMIMNSKYNFLLPSANSNSGDSYYNQILRQSFAACKTALIQNQLNKIEISFPEALKSDVSAAESMDQTRIFGLQLADLFIQQQLVSKDKNEQLWVVFPDKKEVKIAIDRLAKQNNGQSDELKLNFKLTSIDVLMKTLLGTESTDTSLPSTLLVLYPGFNVEEYIALAGLQQYQKPLKIVVVNGNLERLRNGYYPSFFYPKLAQANKVFFQSFTTAYNLRPVAINGDRYAAWLVRNYPQPWQLLTKNTATASTSNYYIVKEEFQEEPKAQDVWNLAKRAF